MRSRTRRLPPKRELEWQILGNLAQVDVFQPLANLPCSPGYGSAKIGSTLTGSLAKRSRSTGDDPAYVLSTVGRTRSNVSYELPRNLSPLGCALDGLLVHLYPKGLRERAGLRHKIVEGRKSLIHGKRVQELIAAHPIRGLPKSGPEHLDAAVDLTQAIFPRLDDSPSMLLKGLGHLGKSALELNHRQAVSRLDGIGNDRKPGRHIIQRGIHKAGEVLAVPSCWLRSTIAV